MHLIDTYKHKGLRKQLVAFLREVRGIQDERILQAIGKIPRHLYHFDGIFDEHAYEDKAFPIGEGQTISQPYTVAYQTQLLDLSESDRVLEIGTGSGYQASVLAEICEKVFTIERHERLYEKTRHLLKSLNYRNIKCFYGDGFKGIPAFAPYDKILITAAAPEIPETLMDQLKTGGYMVLPYGTGENQQMLRIQKQGPGQYSREAFDFFRFVPMLKGQVGK